MSWHCKNNPSVPDQNGVRFCTHCEEFISLAKFPSGTRRYICKAHLWIASGQRSAKKMRNNPQKKSLTKVWARAYKDCRVFKQTRIAITQAEISKLLDRIEKTGTVLETGEIALVPADPTKVLSVSNSALVETSTRSVLIKQWKRSGKDEYCKILQGSDASEETISEREPIALLCQPCN